MDKHKLHFMITKAFTEKPIKAWVDELDDFANVKVSGNEASDTAFFLAEEIMREFAPTNDDEIRLVWHIDDVKSVAPDLSDKECREVLEAVKSNHDAEAGVNWDTLRFWANEVRSERGGA